MGGGGGLQAEKEQQTIMKQHQYYKTLKCDPTTQIATKHKLWLIKQLWLNTNCASS